MPEQGQEKCYECGCIFDNGNHGNFDKYNHYTEIKAFRKCPVCKLRLELKK